MLTAISFAVGMLVVLYGVLVYALFVVGRGVRAIRADLVDALQLQDTLQTMHDELSTIRAEVETADPAGNRGRIQAVEDDLKRIKFSLGMSGRKLS